MKMNTLHVFCVQILLFFANSIGGIAQTLGKDKLPIKGFCIAAPKAAKTDEFVKFIALELAPAGVNTLVLRVDYNYQYQTHPELAATDGLSTADVKKLVAVCRQNNINLIPQVNLLGHQSWHSQLSNLLKAYPEFDETSSIKLPENYVWPNADGLYCKSYCPLHPGVHKVVFEVVDEICEAFEAKAFHAGMDEVFYLGHDSCPRCQGRNKAQLFANEVNNVRNFLAQKNRTLWIWGDRLIDGKNTGIGLWEGSYNNTHEAINNIVRDVVICDWHYERPDLTAVLFAYQGLKVITCPWKNPEVAQRQTQDMYRFRQSVLPQMKDNFAGMMQTVWQSNEGFLDEYYGRKTAANPKLNEAQCFRLMMQEIKNTEQ
jgi:hypothetical protein